MEWSELSESTLSVMKELGNFGPTVRHEDALIKGYMLDEDGDCKVYFDPADLRRISLACDEVANWLEQRKEKTR